MGLYSDLALALDPALILERSGKIPDAWQSHILRSRPRRLLLNCTRQAGKSLTVAAMSLEEALFHDPALVLLLSPTLRQSQELFRVVANLMESIGSSVNPEDQSSLRMELPNGSRIVALPGKEETVRGFSSVALLVIDEAARVADDLYRAVRPMLAVSGGRIVCLSTPWGKRGFFYEEWLNGDEWERVSMTADQCPRISAEFLKQEQKTMPDAWYRQEYFCEFAEAEGAVFSHADIMEALSDDVLPLFDKRAGIISADVQPLRSVS